MTGVSRAAKADFVRSLGAERVVAYDNPAESHDGPYDAIIDTGGDTPLTRLRSMLAPRGTLVIVGGERGDAVTGMGRQLHARILSPFVRQRLTFIVNRERQADLERLRRLVEDGTVKPALDTVFPLDQAADALRHLIAGHTQGKVAIAVDPDQANHGNPTSRTPHHAELPPSRGWNMAAPVAFVSNSRGRATTAAAGMLEPVEPRNGALFSKSART